MGTAFVSMNAISEDYHDYLALRERGKLFYPSGLGADQLSIKCGWWVWLL